MDLEFYSFLNFIHMDDKNTLINIKDIGGIYAYRTNNNRAYVYL